MSSLTLDSIRDIQLYQNKNGYRFSVDALLLASFINLQRVKKIADLGAGSGIVGILLAKKYTEAEVILIELQESLAKLAGKNIVLNNLSERSKIIIADIKELQTHSSQLITPKSFDLVVSNPPFRKVKTGRLSIADEKAIARHEIKLSLNDLMEASFFLLKHHGRLCIIHLPERLSDVISAMKSNSLEPKRLRFVHSNISSEAKMVLIEAVKGGKPGIKTEKPLFIYGEDDNYTYEMKSIYDITQ